MCFNGNKEQEREGVESGNINGSDKVIAGIFQKHAFN